MTRSAMTAAIAALAILTMPAIALAQCGGNSSGSTRSPSAGSLSTGPSGVNDAPGTNSAGTAQSSGSGSNAAPGVTTGAAGTGTMPTSSQSTDAVVAEENKTIDRKLKSICRGC